MGNLNVGNTVTAQVRAAIMVPGNVVSSALHANQDLQDSFNNHLRAQGLDPTKASIQNFGKTSGTLEYTYNGQKMTVSHTTLAGRGKVATGTAPTVSKSVPSRTNVPGSVSARSAPTTAGASSSDRTTISFGKKIVDDNPVLGKDNIFVSGTQAGSARVTAKISTSGAKTAAEDAAGQAAKHATQSSGRTVDHTASRLVAGGLKDSKNLRIAGAAALLGLGALGMRRRDPSDGDISRSLAMQRQGVYKQ